MLSFRQKFTMWSREWIYLHLTSVKTDHPQIAKICLSKKRDFIFKSVYLQEFLSDLTGWGVKI